MLKQFDDRDMHVQEATVRLSVKMTATVAFAVFLLPAYLLRAEAAPKPLAGAKDDSAANSGSTSSAEPGAPMPSASMGAAMPYSAGLNNGTPKVELFVGYSYLRAMPTQAEGNRLVWLNGGSTSIAFNFNRYLGIAADFGGFKNSKVDLTGANPGGTQDANGSVLTFLAGPRVSFRGHERITPFLQVLAGGAHASDVTLSSCTSAFCTVLPAETSFAMTAGGGLDIKVRQHLAIRLIQAEYLMTRFEDLNNAAKATQNDMRLSSGIVFRFGGNSAPPLPPPSPLSYSCSVNPTSVFPGGTIAASGTALNLDPAKTAVYTWTADGGTVAGASSTTNIDTRNVAPGSFTLKGHVSQGEKPSENADCSAPYMVKALEPPTVSCSANPVSVIAGNSSTITATGVSPQNSPLTYSYNSTSGTVTGNGATATLSTAGSTLGTVNVTCNVADEKGQTASGTTSVTVAAPFVAPKPMSSEMCSLHFERDVHRPSRVNNEGKACLDEIALNLQRNSDAKLAIVGNAATKERGSKKLAAERAVNAKGYLVSEKGVDSTRISVYTGSQDAKLVSTTLIPAGATLDAMGNTPVDEGAVKAHPATHHRHNPK